MEFGFLRIQACVVHIPYSNRMLKNFFEGGDLVTGLAKSIERFQSGEAGGNLKMIYMTRSGDRHPILGQI